MLGARTLLRLSRSHLYLELQSHQVGQTNVVQFLSFPDFDGVGIGGDAVH